MSIYKKGKMREDRLNSGVKVKKSLKIIEYESALSKWSRENKWH